MLEIYSHPWIRGFTTNPTLMRKVHFERERPIRDLLDYSRETVQMFHDDARIAAVARGMA